MVTACLVATWWPDFIAIPLKVVVLMTFRSEYRASGEIFDPPANLAQTTH